jgi:hypothetical protein
MAVCEFHECYTEFLSTRITTELDDPVLGKQDLGRAWSVVQSAAICQTLGNISPEEAQIIYNRVFDLYPQFKEQIRAELTQQFG